MLFKVSKRNTNLLQKNVTTENVACFKVSFKTSVFPFKSAGMVKELKTETAI